MFELLGSITTAFTSAKTILDLAKTVNDVQLSARIMTEVGSIQGQLLDTQQKALDLQNENQALRDENQQLYDRLKDRVEFPPCPSCGVKGWHVDSVRPYRGHGEGFLAERVWKCSSCGHQEIEFFNGRAE